MKQKMLAVKAKDDTFEIDYYLTFRSLKVKQKKI